MSIIVAAIRIIGLSGMILLRPVAGSASGMERVGKFSACGGSGLTQLSIRIGVRP